MNFKCTLLLVLVGICPTNVWSQDSKQKDAPVEKAKKSTPRIENPFEIDFGGGGGMDHMMGMDMGMDMGMEEDMEMGMGGMGGYGMSEDELFRRRMEMAIHRMRVAKTDAEKTQLMNYTEAALQARYDRMIEKRQVEIDRLKKSITSLEGDLKRRATAKDRVVKLQMQSAVLAAEGLLDLTTLQSQPAPGMAGGFGGGMGMDMGN